VIHAIVRLFENAARADEGIRRLKGWGFEEAVISRIGPGAAEEATASAIAAAHVLRSHAAVYAKGSSQGWHAGRRARALRHGRDRRQLLDSAGTIDAGPVPGEPRGARWDDAAPLSSALRWGVLSRRGEYFLSPVLLTEEGRTTSSSLGLPELSSGGPTTAGMGLLSRNPTPLSSLLKLPLVI
jgi:hypothetical protein